MAVTSDASGVADWEGARNLVAQAADHFGHLEAGKLPALPRLGALRDLDLDGSGSRRGG